MAQASRFAAGSGPRLSSSGRPPTMTRSPSQRVTALAAAMAAEADRLVVLDAIPRGRLGGVYRANFRNMEVHALTAAATDARADDDAWVRQTGSTANCGEERNEK